MESLVLLRMIWFTRQLVRTFSNNAWKCYSEPARISFLQNAVTRHVSSAPLLRTHNSLTFGLLYCNKWTNIDALSRGVVKCYGIPRQYSTVQEKTRKTNVSVILYITAVAIVVLGMSYAAVPLYRLFCQVVFLH